MQPNQLDFTVDPLNNATTEVQSFTHWRTDGNKAVYIGANHVPEMRNEMALYRTPSTRSGNFKGVSKSAIKFTEDISVEGVDSSTSLTAPMILEISFSLPVGFTDAQAEELRQRAIGALDDSTFMKALNTQLMI